jgi:hypothetical protein
VIPDLEIIAKMIAITTILFALVISTTNSEHGLVRSVTCFRNSATITLYTDSAFANATFKNGNIGALLNPENKTSCSFIILPPPPVATPTWTIDYTSCEATQVTVIQYEKSFLLTTVSLQALNVDNPHAYTQDFTVVCKYDTQTNTSSNGTIHGNGGSGGNPGNNTGNANTTVTQLAFGKKDGHSGKLIPIKGKTVYVGDTLFLSLELTGSDVYRSMWPEWCYFSTLQNADKPEIIFIDNRCPSDTIGVVQNYYYNGNSTQMVIQFTGFILNEKGSSKPPKQSAIYAFCTVDLCLDKTDARCLKPPSCPSGNLQWSSNFNFNPISGFSYSAALAAMESDDFMFASQPDPHQLQGQIIISKGGGSATTWYIVVGVLGGLLCVAILVAAVIFGTRHRKPVPPTVPNREIKYVTPLQIPRAQMDYTTLSSHTSSS